MLFTETPAPIRILPVLHPVLQLSLDRPPDRGLFSSGGRPGHLHLGGPQGVHGPLRRPRIEDARDSQRCRSPGSSGRGLPMRKSSEHTVWKVAKVIGFVGTFQFLLDEDRFIDMVETICGEHPEAVFLLVGEGTARPRLSQPDRGTPGTGADVSPSREPFPHEEVPAIPERDGRGDLSVPRGLPLLRLSPLKCLEYMAAGKAVVGLGPGADQGTHPRRLERHALRVGRCSGVGGKGPPTAQ